MNSLVSFFNQNFSMRILIYFIGFLAQAFFSARIIIQWFLSEKAKKIVSPNIFWILSLVGSYLLFFYGWLRSDFSIILGQLISYYIYVWNLNLNGIWHKINIVFRIVFIATPFIAIVYAWFNFNQFFTQFFQHEDIPIWMIVFGSVGQITFTLRFIYQWIYSYKRNESTLPIGFWVISLIGSGIIISYAVLRLDPVLLLGQSVGFLAYSRNLILGKRSNRK